MDQCVHEDDGTNMCCHCSQELGRLWDERSQVPKVRTQAVKSIWNDLADIDKIPVEIRRRADALSREFQFPTHRGVQRKREVLYCLYEAAKECQSTLTPKDLCLILGMKPTEIGCLTALAMKMALTRQHTDTIRLETPLSLLKTVAGKLKLEKTQYESLETLSKTVLDENPRLNTLPPLHVAAALMCYYHENRYTTTLDFQSLSDLIKVPVVSIQTAYREIYT